MFRSWVEVEFFPIILSDVSSFLLDVNEIKLRANGNFSQILLLKTRQKNLTNVSISFIKDLNNFTK